MKRLLLAIVALLLVWSQTAAAATHVIRAEGFVFIPSSLDIVQGDTVIWTNTTAGMTHTTTSGTPPGGDGLWNGSLSSGASYTRVFSSVGDYDYFCILHWSGGMTGVIHVAGSPWAGASDAGGGWSWLSWFGFFYQAFSPWIFHQQLEWMYVSGTSDGDIWLYSTIFNSWIWTSQSVYPFLYRAQPAAWLYYLPDSTSPRWFFNYGNSRWENY